MKKFFAFLVLLTVTQLCLASTNPFKDYILTLAIINNSTQTLTYTGVSGENMGNTFLISPTRLSPGQKATLIGITNPYYDLSGAVNFTDPTGESNVLSILDPRQIKSTEGIFAMMNQHFISFDTKILNPSTNPRSLLYNNVVLVIQDNVSKKDYPTK